MTAAAGPVTLTWYEFVGCVEVGMLRFATASADNRNHANTQHRDFATRLHDEVIGACAERAVCKLLGLYWDGSVNTFHRQADAPGGIEVRATGRADGCLIIRSNDDLGRLYALVLGRPPALSVAGFIRGSACRQHPEWLRDPRGLRPAYFVPQSALAPYASGGGSE